MMSAIARQKDEDLIRIVDGNRHEVPHLVRAQILTDILACKVFCNPKDIAFKSLLCVPLEI